MQATRFQVSGRNGDDQSSDDDDEAQDLLEGNQDTKMYNNKSFRHFTREALPRLDNYRNMLSIQAQNRPTLEELHNATLSQKVNRLQTLPFALRTITILIWKEFFIRSNLNLQTYLMTFYTCIVSRHTRATESID